MLKPALRSNDDVADDGESFAVHLDAEFFAELAFAGLICRLAGLDTTTYQAHRSCPTVLAIKT